jgi:2-amino-4-hydroxy-6-hydroxymethyldihydropteridine diphosphokinase
VALGSNLGDSEDILNAVIAKLQGMAEGPLLRSSFWRTKPADCPPGSPDFLNAVVVFKPRQGETAAGLLQKLQALEREFGRKPKTVLNEPRPLDLDLIAFGTERLESASLTLPHPRAAQRLFVLGPLAEIAPNLRLPGTTQTARELARTLSGRH